MTPAWAACIPDSANASFAKDVTLRLAAIARCRLDCPGRRLSRTLLLGVEREAFAPPLQELMVIECRGKALSHMIGDHVGNGAVELLGSGSLEIRLADMGQVLKWNAAQFTCGVHDCVGPGRHLVCMTP